MDQDSNNPNILGTIAPLAGYMALWGVQSQLAKRSPFSMMNPGLVKGMERAQRGNPVLDRYRRLVGRQISTSAGRQNTFLAKYYNEQYASNVASWNKGLEEANKVRLLEKGAFNKAARGAFSRMGAARTLGKVLGVIDIAWMAPMLFGATYHGFKGIQKLGRRLETPNMMSGLSLTSLAATDRARSMQAMHGTELNARRAIGQEAALLHS